MLILSKRNFNFFTIFTEYSIFNFEKIIEIPIENYNLNNLLITKAVSYNEKNFFLLIAKAKKHNFNFTFFSTNLKPHDYYFYDLIKKNEFIIIEN